MNPDLVTTDFGPDRLAVLVVDDNPAMRYATARVLRAAGFETREAETGAEALTLATADVAAVILDVHLPDTDGFAVCRELRSRPYLDSVPVIHLSAAFVDAIDKVRGLEGGADAYLTHPADPPLLVATVNALIRARRAERGMQRSEARFRGIYDMAHSGIALIDDQGRIAECNAAFLTLLGRQHDELSGQRLVDLAPEDRRDDVTTHLRHAGRGAWHGEFPLLDAKGDLMHMAWSMSAHIEEGVVMAIASDISERVALSRQREELLEREQAARVAAERVSRTKGELIAILSHELRTPLNAILTWAHLLQRSPDKLERGLEVIQRNAKAQSRLISDILDMSRMDVGKLRLDIAPVDLEELLGSAVETLNASLQDKGLQVHITMDGMSRPPLRADYARLQQIIWNLLTNAIKFSPKGASIWLSAHSQHDRVVLSVRDEGRGIPADFLPYIFERFSQSDAASNRLHGGLGLGLSIVKHLAELHGGRATALSEGEGLGAEFTVELPCNETFDTHISTSESTTGFDELKAHPELQGMRILVVEDDMDSLDITSMVLREHGAQVEEAHGADEATLRLLESWPDVLVSDIGLPGRDGYALMQDVRHMEKAGKVRIHAVALTAFSRPQDRDRAFQAGFDAYCAKPLRPAELLEAIVTRKQ